MIPRMTAAAVTPTGLRIAISLSKRVDEFSAPEYRFPIVFPWENDWATDNIAYNLAVK